jgi:hypothetical protein
MESGGVAEVDLATIWVIHRSPCESLIGRCVVEIKGDRVRRGVRKLVDDMDAAGLRTH